MTREPEVKIVTRPMATLIMDSNGEPAPPDSKVPPSASSGLLTPYQAEAHAQHNGYVAFSWEAEHAAGRLANRFAKQECYTYPQWCPTGQQQWYSPPQSASQPHKAGDLPQGIFGDDDLLALFPVQFPAKTSEEGFEHGTGSASRKPPFAVCSNRHRCQPSGQWPVCTENVPLCCTAIIFSTNDGSQSQGIARHNCQRTCCASTRH